MRRIAKISRFMLSVPGAALIVLVIVLIIPALFADFIAPHDPYKANIRSRLEPPLFFGGTTEFILGTDRLGRDVFSRIIHGAKFALGISMAGILLGAVVGTTLGLMAGFLGGWWDATIMRAVDITFALPSILLALALASVSGPSFELVIFVVIFVIWGYFARQVRAETLALRELDFVARARVLGASEYRIMWKYILPNIVNTIVVLGTLQIGVVIILEATLSFLGIGIPRPTPAWGLLVADGRQLIVSSWWISFTPGLAILLTVMSVNVLGDALRDVLDPKSRSV